jgi:ABC-2 type transport system permease protein
LLALISIFIFSLKGLALLGSKIAEFQTIIYLSVFVFNVLFISTLSLRFVFPIVSLEGESFWKIRTSPLDTIKTVKIKLIIYFIPIFIIAQILSYFANLKFSGELIVYSGIITTFACIVLVLLNFGMGAVFANYKEKNPIRISSSQGAAISFLLNILFMIFLVIVLLTPLNNYFIAINKHYLPDFSKIIITSFLIGIASLIISLVIYRFSKSYILRDF